MSLVRLRTGISRLYAWGLSSMYTSSASHNSEGKDPKQLKDEEWRAKLTPEQFNVCRQKATEMPFSGTYYDHHEEGLYNCICCGASLFSSEAKYNSGSGWPSFFDVHKQPDEKSQDKIVEKEDTSAGKTRTEILCANCNSHLGHVFPDGPPPTGLRYCVNSAALKFKAKE